MSRVLDILFALLKTALLGKQINVTLLPLLSNEEWKRLFNTCRQQGLIAVVYDVISLLPKEQQPPRELKLQWALSAEKIKGRYNKQRQLAMELADAFADKGINTYVLKGLAISGYYPTPEHRECGDLDCFLASVADNGEFVPRYEDGNVIAEKIGAEVERDYYKHSHINFKGLMVENHAFCTAIRGSKDRKAFERHLQHLLATKPSTPIDGSHLMRPCADFNALFLTAHGMGHFIS